MTCTSAGTGLGSVIVLVLVVLVLRWVLLVRTAVMTVCECLLFLGKCLRRLFRRVLIRCLALIMKLRSIWLDISLVFVLTVKVFVHYSGPSVSGWSLSLLSWVVYYVRRLVLLCVVLSRRLCSLLWCVIVVRFRQSVRVVILLVRPTCTSFVVRWCVVLLKLGLVRFLVGHGACVMGGGLRSAVSVDLRFDSRRLRGEQCCLGAGMAEPTDLVFFRVMRLGVVLVVGVWLL